MKRRTLLTFGAVALPATTLHVPAGNLLPTFYAEHTSLPLAAMGTAMLLARAFDAISDPLIGRFSDATRTRLGARKPWIVGGCCLAMAAVFIVLAPPAAPSLLYVLMGLVLLSLGWTMMEIPHLAWGSELAKGYHERTRIFSYRQVLGGVGALAFVALPLLPFFEGRGYSREVFFAAAAALAVLLPLTTAVTVRFAPTVPVGKKAEPLSWRAVAKLRSSGPLMRFFAMFVLFGIGTGMYGPLFFLYVGLYLGLSEELALFSIALLGVGILALPVWLIVIKRIGKHVAWAVSSFLLAVQIPLLLLFDPESPNVAALVMLGIALGASQAAGQAVSYAILADIVDYERLKKRGIGAGVYYALYLLVQKANQAIGSGTGLWIAAAFGFGAGVAIEPRALFGIELAMAWIPASMLAVSGVLAVRFPLNKSRVAVIQRRLERADTARPSSREKVS